MIKQQKKTTKEEEKSTLPAKSFLYFFWGPMGLGGTLANFFSAFLEFAPGFQETNVYEPNFATFFWWFQWFPFYHFHILLVVLMNLDVIFSLGLEIKPCESRLEFVHPPQKKTKNKW